MGTWQSPHLKVMLFPRAIQLLQSDQFEMLNEWETFPQLNYSWHTYLEFVHSSEKGAVWSPLFLFPQKNEEAFDQFGYSWCSRRPLIQQQFDDAFFSYWTAQNNALFRQRRECSRKCRSSVRLDRVADYRLSLLDVRREWGLPQICSFGDRLYPTGVICTITCLLKSWKTSLLKECVSKLYLHLYRELCNFLA